MTHHSSNLFRVIARVAGAFNRTAFRAIICAVPCLVRQYLIEPAKLIPALFAAMSLTYIAHAQQPQLSMLDQLDSGRWELRLRSDGTIIESLCVQNGRRLIQLRHPQNQCEHYVIDDQRNSVTVQYTCRGKGYGRTHIRRESARLVQIESQGIASGYPFDLSAEARRIGECGS